ncbi:hypothetical protein M0R72_15605 [Candidatus Pacearchaeota archaeon]|jgi:predicted S18 family serine protease|nr:hypothetical protein [Candidatus Pacearchaeota archaeon]
MSNIYADKYDLADYLGIEVADITASQERQLERASELVDHVTLGNIDTTDADHNEAAAKAVCAQVEYWGQHGEENVSDAAIKEKQFGKTRIVYADTNKSGGTVDPDLCRRAERYLFDAGLLYRGTTLR